MQYYHNVSGPAVVCGFKNEWWFNGVQYSFSEWCELSKICDTKRYLLTLIYGDK